MQSSRNAPPRYFSGSCVAWRPEQRLLCIWRPYKRAMTVLVFISSLTNVFWPRILLILISCPSGDRAIEVLSSRVSVKDAFSSRSVFIFLLFTMTSWWPNFSFFFCAFNSFIILQQAPHVSIICHLRTTVNKKSFPKNFPKSHWSVCQLVFRRTECLPWRLLRINFRADSVELFSIIIRMCIDSTSGWDVFFFHFV